MTETELRRFLSGQGLLADQARFKKLKGGYLNSVWRVDTEERCLAAKEFAVPMTGTLFPNLPEDEAEALRRLTGQNVAPELVGFWPEESLLVYEYVEGDMWDSDTESVAKLLLRKEGVDPTGFRKVSLQFEDILFEGDALFARCQNLPEIKRPIVVEVPSPDRVSLIHTDVGVNLVGNGANLRLIDWQCPAAGDICEDIFSFISPAFQILAERKPLSSKQVEEFWQALSRPDLFNRYTVLYPAYAWRFGGYCAWRSEVLEDEEVCTRYRRALAAELMSMKMSA